MNLKQLTTALASHGFNNVNPLIMLYKFQTGNLYNTQVPPHWLDVDYSKTKADIKRELRARGEDTNILSSLERQLLSGKKSLKPIMVLRTGRKLNIVIEGMLTVQVAAYLSRHSTFNIPARVEEPNNYTEADLLNTIGTLLLRSWNEGTKRPNYGSDPCSFTINVSSVSLTFHSVKQSDMFTRSVMRAMDIYHNYLQDPGYLALCLNEYDATAKFLVPYLAEGNTPILTPYSVKLRLAAHLCSIDDRYFPSQAPHEVDLKDGRIFQNEKYAGGSYMEEELTLYMNWMNNPALAFKYSDSKSESIRALAKDFLINGPPDPGVLYV
jgi:hypothetical protein